MARLLARRRAAPGLALLVLASGLLITGAGASARVEDRPAAAAVDRLQAFDIPAQPLPGAMLAFSRISNVQVLYDSHDAARATCNPVSGRMSSGQALRELLQGTGFVIHYVGPRAVTLVLPGETAPAALRLDTLQVESAPVRIGGTRFTAYADEVLTDVRRAMQDDVAAVQARREVIVKLWLAPNGRVQRTEIVKSTGDAAADAAVGRSIAGVVVGHAPPDGLPQPLIYEFWTGPGS
jgi:TonB family protein